MNIEDTITKPKKIIPEHLQHNAKEWNKHHMAGKERTHLDTHGIGYEIKEPKIELPLIYCEHCGKNFKNKKSMTNHRRWHKLPQYEDYQKKFSKDVSISLNKFWKTPEAKRVKKMLLRGLKEFMESKKYIK